MKKSSYIFRLLVLVVLGAAMASCGGSADHAKLIPDDAKFVAVIDAKALMQKGKLDELSDADFYDAMVGEMPKAMKEKMEELIEDPSKSGIDYSQPIFVSDGVVAMALSSEDDFIAMMKDIAKAAEEDEPEIEEGDGYKYIDMGGNTLAFGNGVLASFDTDDQDEIAKRFKGEDALVDKNDDFKSFLGDTKDISVWADKGQAKMLTEQDGVSLEGDLHVFVDFQDGAIELTSNVILEKDMVKQVEGMAAMMKDQIELSFYKDLELDASDDQTIAKILLTKDDENSLFVLISSADELQGLAGGMGGAMPF